MEHFLKDWPSLWVKYTRRQHLNESLLLLRHHPNAQALSIAWKNQSVNFFSCWAAVWDSSWSRRFSSLRAATSWARWVFSLASLDSLLSRRLTLCISWLRSPFSRLGTSPFTTNFDVSGTSPPMGTLVLALPLKLFFKFFWMGHLIPSFQTHVTNFTTNRYVKIFPYSIRCWDSSSQPVEHEFLS